MSISWSKLNNSLSFNSLKICNMFSFFNLQSIFLPLIKSAKNKKTHYNSIDDIYLSYRKKKIFSNFTDSDLKILIKSITIEERDGVNLIYPSDWDSRIYKTSMRNDMFIWNNISKLDLKIVILRAKASNVFFFFASVSHSSSCDEKRYKKMPTLTR